jgi:hypothetical protein
MAVSSSSPLQVEAMHAYVELTKASLLHKQVLSVAEQPLRSAVVMQANESRDQLGSL